MAKIDVFNMCYGVGAVNPFDCLMRQKSKESNSRRDLLYGMTGTVDIEVENR